jgi:hypothetical protein
MQRIITIRIIRILDQKIKGRKEDENVQSGFKRFKHFEDKF